MALYRLSINSEYLGFEGHEGKKDSDKERAIVGIYIGKWKLRFFLEDMLFLNRQLVSKDVSCI